jgi:hypothetical protein
MFYDEAEETEFEEGTIRLNEQFEGFSFVEDEYSLQDSI